MEGKFDKNKVMLIISLTVIMFFASVLGAVVIIKSCNVDTSVATPDEAEPVTEYVEVVSDDNTTPTLPNGEEYTFTQDWNELKGINEEIVAWIEVPNTKINYPVLKHEGDGPGYEYYLHRNFDHSYLFAGSIFIDYRSKQSVDSRNVITHGHKMNNGTMYMALLDYGTYEGDLEFYKNAPTIFFNTPNGVEQWIIFSVYKTNTLESHGDFFNYLLGEFDSDAQYMNYIYNIRERSLFDVPVPINEDDQILTLSTCSNEYGHANFRTVVVARKLRPGESAKQYIDGATLNEDPYWPDVYYTDHSTPRPELTTFKTELSKGNIDWYDGKGNLKGNEWLPTSAGKKSFTVTFINYDGTILSTQTVPHGSAAVPPEDPVKPSIGDWDYVFTGWQLDFSYVDCNMTIAPDFEAVYSGE